MTCNMVLEQCRQHLSYSCHQPCTDTHAHTHIHIILLQDLSFDNIASCTILLGPTDQQKVLSIRNASCDIVHSSAATQHLHVNKGANHTLHTKEQLACLGFYKYLVGKAAAKTQNRWHVYIQGCSSKKQSCASRDLRVSFP